VISLHGSDVYVAERHAVAGRAARMAFARAGWVTACSDDLRRRAIALGARDSTTETLPYGVDAMRFRPNPEARSLRRELGLEPGPLVFAAGRLVRKKGFEYLIEAAGRLRNEFPSLRVAIAGTGDLEGELAALAARFPGTVSLLGNRSQDDIGRLSAAADVVAVPSTRDHAGNVDGLPNFALEATATATPVVATCVGGLSDLIDDGVTGLLVGDRDATALEGAIRALLRNPARARQLGEAGRAKVMREFGWDRYAERLEGMYERLTTAGNPRRGA
jgi:glycosyltransferase involved in cell wall biosynthesis